MIAISYIHLNAGHQRLFPGNCIPTRLQTLRPPSYHERISRGAIHSLHEGHERKVEGLLHQQEGCHFGAKAEQDYE